ncbi:MAG: DegT/DnrJ/EryC1/StrS family aminotransferase [Sandaracinaceae bacterium]|nr:DegT/DnrJ/EryC1/StrS family aminotransferase [Sandaracinaceae bacterium]
MAGELPILEDAAQSFLARYGGRPRGQHRDGWRGHCSSPARTWVVFGDGGLVTTRDPAMAESACASCAHGSELKYHHAGGWNFRLTRSRPRACCT